MSPEVSIIITNFNYARFLGAAIESALAQRAASVEVIVVDDGSTDGSREVMANFSDRIQGIFTTNSGQGAAFNAGWRCSSGDVVIFLDADDMLVPNLAAKVIDTMKKQPATTRVQFPLAVIDEDGHRTGATMPTQPERLFRGDPRPLLLTCPDDIVWQPTSGNAFARQALEQILPMPETPYHICADYYLSSLASLHGQVAVIDQVGGEYRVHGQNQHFSDVETLERLRQNIQRTSATHGYLINECRRIDLSGPSADPNTVRSVTATTNRVLSYRFDPAPHPIQSDTRLGLFRLGIRSAWARRDVSLTRRFAFGGWFALISFIPLRWLPLVARPYVKIGVRGTRSGVPQESSSDQHKHQRR